MAQNLREPRPPELISVWEDLGRTQVLHVFDEIDIATSPQLQTELTSPHGAGDVVLDLLSCRYIDSTALSALIRAHKDLGKRLRIVVSPGGRIEHVLKITGLYGALPIFDDLERALAAGEMPERISLA